MMSKNSVINNKIEKISWFYRLNGNSLRVLFKIMKTIKIYTFVIIYIQIAPSLLRVIKTFESPLQEDCIIRISWF